MQVRWTTAAASDLESIAGYLFEKTPENAARLIREICDAVFALRIYQTEAAPAGNQEHANWYFPHCRT